MKLSPFNRKNLAKLPNAIGVYFFQKGKEILYIGKAVSLKARILSHFENAKLDPKEALIIQNSDDIRYRLTDSEFKALLLESYLIQKHQPKYNLRWKDDKSYLYIKVTIKDEFPKIYSVRKESDGRSLYFGPFPSQKDVEHILALIRKIFPFCQQKKISKTPCFYSKIGLCDPCPSSIAPIDDIAQRTKLKSIYRNNIRGVIRILRGNLKLALKDSYKTLKVLSKKQDYEKALRLRDKIRRFEQLIYQSQFTIDVPSDFNRSAEATRKLFSILKVYFKKLESLHRIECYDISNLFQKDATASMVVFTDGLPDKSQYKRFRIKSKTSLSDFEMLEEVFFRRFKQNWPRPDLIVVDGGTPQVLKVKQILNNIKNEISYKKMENGNRNLKIENRKKSNFQLPISNTNFQFPTTRFQIPIIGIAKHPDRLVINAPDKLITLRPSSVDLGFILVRSLRDEAHRFAKKYHLLLRNKRIMI